MRPAAMYKKKSKCYHQHLPLYEKGKQISSSFFVNGSNRRVRGRPPRSCFGYPFVSLSSLLPLGVYAYNFPPHNRQDSNLRQRYFLIRLFSPNPTFRGLTKAAMSYELLNVGRISYTAFDLITWCQYLTRTNLVPLHFTLILYQKFGKITSFYPRMVVIWLG